MVGLCLMAEEREGYDPAVAGICCPSWPVAHGLHLTLTPTCQQSCLCEPVLTDLSKKQRDCFRWEFSGDLALPDWSSLGNNELILWRAMFPWMGEVGEQLVVH